MKINLFVIFIAFLFVTACVESEVCSTETTAILNVEMLNSEGDKVPDSVLHYMSVGILSRDSIFYGAFKPKEAYLLLNPFADTASYLVSIFDLYKKYIYDTILLQTAIDSSYDVIDTVTYLPDTTVTYLSDIDSIYNTNIFDTLTLSYSRTNSYLNDACGFTFEFKLQSVHYTTNNIDSVKINFKNVLLDASENHLSFYIHTAANNN